MKGKWLSALAAGVGIAQMAPALPPRPRLIVAISVDQFSAELFQRYRATYTGGLRRLADGMTFTGYQSHAATETCPGHSTILTGRHPAATGIVANSWPDRETGKDVYCVSVPGADPDARGPQNLRVGTLGDWLKQMTPQSRVFTVSGKDRAAIMMGGHRADGIYWWSDGAGFGTSPYAVPATPAVTVPAVTYDKALFAAWRRDKASLWPADISASCAALEQPRTFGKLSLSGHVPPDAALAAERDDDIVASKAFQDQLRASPLFDQLTEEFAERVIDEHRLGHGREVDLLGVSFSATDYVGHRYGNGGPEMCVQMAALDRTIGRLLARLDSLKVPYVVALTADHGSTDAAERVAERGIRAQRIDPGAFRKALNDHLRATLNLNEDPIVGDDVEQLFIRTGDAAWRRQVRDAAIAWLKQRPEVVQVLTPEEIEAAAPPRGKPVTQLSFAERFHESYDRARSGDIAVVYTERASLGMPKAAGNTVAGHGSVWDYDRRVPILFWWPGVPKQARPEPIETVDIAPTLAAIGGIAAPPVDGRCLASVAGACPAVRR